jgi:hypothetical protein
MAKRRAVAMKRNAKKLAKAARLQPFAVLEGATEPGSASGAAKKTLLDSGGKTRVS